MVEQTGPTGYAADGSCGTISPDQLIPDPAQPRKEFDQEKIAALADNIKKHGQITPIKVRWSGAHDRWIIVCGERRWRAVTLAGLPFIRCTFIAGEMTETQIREEQLIENLQREDLTPIEKASSYKQLMQLENIKANELAVRLSLDKTTVCKTLALLDLPEDVRAQVASGEIAASIGYELSLVQDPEVLRQLARAAAAGQTRAQVKAAIKQSQKSAGQANVRQPPTNETFHAGPLRITVAGRRHSADQAILDALLEAADRIRRRLKKAS